eukprot:280491-Lingulodinium_polyedra.AAC.1
MVRQQQEPRAMLHGWLVKPTFFRCQRNRVYLTVTCVWHLQYATVASKMADFAIVLVACKILVEHN